MTIDFADATRTTLISTTVAGSDLSFDPATLDGLPEPAQRFLNRALPPGVPLSTAVELTMEGEMKLGGRWLPFSADQILRAGVGFVWAPTVGGRIIRFTGADVLGPAGARIEFRFHGRIPVVRGSGADIEHSAVGRLAAETVAWLPQALTPQAGATWSVRCRQRHRGWDWDTPEQVDGEFFHYTINISPFPPMNTANGDSPLNRRRCTKSTRRQRSPIRGRNDLQSDNPEPLDNHTPRTPPKPLWIGTSSDPGGNQNVRESLRQAQFETAESKLLSGRGRLSGPRLQWRHVR